MTGFSGILSFPNALVFSAGRRYDASVGYGGKSMKLSAFAKINWSLDITGVREDGYHLMDMVMQPVSISDEITLAPSGGLSISASGFPRVRADGSNLAYRAALALKNAAGYAGGASIHVEKSIPLQML